MAGLMAMWTQAATFNLHFAFFVQKLFLDFCAHSLGHRDPAFVIDRE
jgi:hypothetical protein